MDYTAHIYQLARDHRIAILEVPGFPPEEAYSVPVKRAIVCAPVTEATTYCIALHEMGHIATETHPEELRLVRSTRDVIERLEREDAAWAWARRHAAEWDDVMEFVYQYARTSYAEHLRGLLSTYIHRLPKPLEI